MTVAHCFQRLNQVLCRRKVHTVRDCGRHTQEASQLCQRLLSQRCTERTLQIIICGSGKLSQLKSSGAHVPYLLRSGEHRPLLAARLLKKA